MTLLTALKDLLGTLLLVFLLPLWILVGIAAMAILVTRQLHWWVRGNTTAGAVRRALT